MTRRLGCVLGIAGLLLYLSLEMPARAQDVLLTTPAVSGYEQGLASALRESLKDFSPKTDNVGNVIVTLGSGAPHRLIVTPMDEPGYVVSEITSDGYLRVQRLPQRAPNAVFDLLHAAQPVWVMTRDRKKIPGVFAGLSVHLQPGRKNAPTMAHPDEMYVDIGATSAQEVSAAGVDLLDPVALSRTLQNLGGDERTAPAIGDRFGCEALVDVLRLLHGHTSNLKGTLTVAFAAQQWTGGRGLDRLLNELHPHEMIYVARITLPRSEDSKPGTASANPVAAPGAGVLLGVSDISGALTGLAADLKKMGEEQHVTIKALLATPLTMGGYAEPTPLPAQFVHLGVASLFPVTPAETISTGDVAALETLLYRYAAGSAPESGAGLGGGVGGGLSEIPLIQSLTETYGVSGHEERVREQVKKLLPGWAKPETDAAGNLVLKLGTAKAGSNAPKLVFIAHMDEIGYQVRSIEPDGRLLMDVLGGGYTEYFLGHVMLLQKTDGSSVAGVLELPSGWDQPAFEWPHGPQAMDEAVHLYVGTHSAEETQKLGIRVGDWATIPKKYRPLIGTRANARSFDDRVGCAALIAAVKVLGPDVGDRQVTFIWSTEEEVGLKGAAAAAERMAKDGTSPDFVFAIDTFVSSDSPLESKRFADAEIGKGFVIRAVDNSNITPRQYVDRVVKLARENKIPAQYGATGGGNDGAVFVRYGAVDVPLSWPLRYAHSPGEVIDTHDLDALGKIVAVLAKKW
ncbi:MAG: M20/M25/M40 family metallo-hydrolase [Candidatus Acidiferrum sp.]